MNYLAHIYLSGNEKMLTIGNFIADGIRGKKYKMYPIEVQKGILLHRQIDTFTDGHPTVRQSTKRLHENYGHYSGIIVDILYDHFLAKNWSRYSDVPLEDYAENFYQILTDNIEILPQRILKMIPHLISGNWLVSYATKDGIAKVLDGMNKRTKNRSQMNLATKELDLFYEEFEAEFTSFFEELIAFSEEKLIQINQELS